MIKVLNINLITSGTAKDSYFLFLGTIISNLFNFLIIILLSNNLSIAELGIFLTAVTFIQVLVDGLDFGINPAILNFASGNISEKNLYLWSSLVLKILIGSIASLFIYFFSGFIGENILMKAELIPLLQISSLGLFLMIIVTWLQIVLQAERKFLFASIVNTLPNIFRYMLLSLLIMIGYFNILNGYFVFNLAFLGAVIIGLFLIKLQLTEINFKALINYSAGILRFGLPVGLSFLIAALYTRVDQLMLFTLAGAEEAGIYGLAFRLNLFFIFAATALNSALVVRFTTLEGKKFWEYFRKSIFIYLLIAVGVICSLLLVPFIWNIFFKLETVNSILPFQILGLGTVCFILSLPFASALLYRYKKNLFGLYISMISLVSVLGLLYILIPLYQSIGAAMAVLIVYALQLLITVIYFLGVTNDKN